MRQQLWKPVILAMASLSLTALVPLTVCAQDRQDEHRDQQTEHRDDQSTQRDDHHDGDRGDQATQYRHDHPRASARCHDGFFTSTRDRNRACSKHGGIDVWIAL
jgi:hypothetical protein